MGRDPQARAQHRRRGGRVVNRRSPQEHRTRDMHAHELAGADIVCSHEVASRAMCPPTSPSRASRSTVGGLDFRAQRALPTDDVEASPDDEGLNKEKEEEEEDVDRKQEPEETKTVAEAVVKAPPGDEPTNYCPRVVRSKDTGWLEWHLSPTDLDDIADGAYLLGCDGGGHRQGQYLRRARVRRRHLAKPRRAGQRARRGVEVGGPRDYGYGDAESRPLGRYLEARRVIKEFAPEQASLWEA
ncbi:hypothetical protein VTK73DRAFT_5528 [Phialemonium thermophilum]|uniref:Uncharacterized protein n=1 Tax=Phialemonium thermophilum TaxID=223376 RepID=A0ABR3V198_9PEZI